MCSNLFFLKKNSIKVHAKILQLLYILDKNVKKTFFENQIPVK